MLITQAGGGGGFGNSSTHRGNVNFRLVPRDERKRSNDRDRTIYCVRVRGEVQIL